MPPAVEVLPSKAALLERALDYVVSQIQQAVHEHGYCTLALSGGSTPRPLYEALAQQPLPLEQLHIFWGDERYVAWGHPESNYRMVQQAWLTPAKVPVDNIHGVPTNLANPEASALAYEQEIQAFFADRGQPERFPSFDLVLLGMGDDGHTASLFPGTKALGVSDRLITVGNKDGQPRITFTVPLINQARQVVFLVAGESKRPALAQVFAADGDAMAYPSRLIQPLGSCLWLMDAAAGETLDGQTLEPLE